MTYNHSMLEPGPVAMFGNPLLFPLLRQAQAEKRDWYYGDHAYFGRRVYYRITKNAFQHNCYGDAHPQRWERLGIRIKPWQKTGGAILLCPQSAAFYELHGMNRDQWIIDTTTEIRRYTDRPIILRNKASGLATEDLFRQSLHGVHAVVVYTSVAGAQAALEGVPCFATHDCASAKFGTTDLSRIENPVRPDNREQMAWVLADNQWTFDEMAGGMAWEKIR